MSDFSATFKKALKDRHISQNKFAQFIGVSSSTVYKWGRGEVLPQENMVRKIERLLDMEPGTLQKIIDASRTETEYEHKITDREKKILAAWNRGDRTPEDVSKITGYSLKIVGLYLPLGIEKEYQA